MATCAIVQARIGSTRLPGKVLADIAGRSMLARVVERAQATEGIDVVVVATSVSPTDDPIATAANLAGWRLFRGSEDDVLDRYYRAAVEVDASHVLRLTADCPFYSPREGGRVVQRHLESNAAYTHNLTVWGSEMPLGTGTEMFTIEALETSWREGLEPHHREHVDEFVCEHPDRFAVELVKAPPDLARPNLRLTVDEPADLELARAIHARLSDREPLLEDVVRLLDAEPELAGLNRHVRQKTV